VTILLLLGDVPPSSDGSLGRRRAVVANDAGVRIDGGSSAAEPDTSEPNAAAIAARLRAGDEAALGELHAHYWAPLVRYATRALGARDIAEEVVQEVFIALWQRREALIIHGTFRAYLFGAVHRRAHHTARTEHRLHHREVTAGVRLHAIHSDLSGADAALRMAELEGIVRDTIGALPARCKDVLFLYLEDELTVAEIAETLGIAAATVRVQIHRAMTAIWERVEGYLA